MIFLCFVSFHPGKEMQWGLGQSLIHLDNHSVKFNEINLAKHSYIEITLNTVKI